MLSTRRSVQTVRTISTRKMTHHTVVAATQLLVSAVMNLMVVQVVARSGVMVIVMMSLIVLVDMMDVEATVVHSVVVV
jgi:hypothetical protein